MLVHNIKDPLEQLLSAFPIDGMKIAASSASPMPGHAQHTLCCTMYNLAAVELVWPGRRFGMRSAPQVTGS